jgi:hypothetical protein
MVKDDFQKVSAPVYQMGKKQDMRQPPEDR